MQSQACKHVSLAFVALQTEMIQITRAKNEAASKSSAVKSAPAVPQDVSVTDVVKALRLGEF
jgi:hypothetical protein